MKHTYLRPESRLLSFYAESQLLAASDLVSDGNGNTTVTPDPSQEFGGEFDSNSRHWDSSSWE